MVSSDTPLLQHESTPSSKKHFGVTIDQLCSLVDDNHNPKLLTELGGMMGICQALKVDPTVGLAPDESFDPHYGIHHDNSNDPDKKRQSFIERKEAFGYNETPSVPEQTILSLIWAAYNDQTLSNVYLILKRTPKLLMHVYVQHSHALYRIFGIPCGGHLGRSLDQSPCR